MKKSTRKSYRVRNWREYNAALVNRGSLTLWISEDVVSAWTTAGLSGRRGSSDYYSDLAIECALTLRAVYHLPLRQTEGLLGSIVELMGVEIDIPDHSTLSRRARRLSISLASSAAREARDVVVDSTGLKVYGEGEWKVRQHGYSKRRTWRKLHLGIDGGEIVAAEMTSNDVGDSEVFASLLEQIDGEIASVSGDGAYDARDVYAAIEKRGARAVIPPQRGAVIWQHGNSKSPPHPRDENLRAIRTKGRKRWKIESGYHRRSLAETMMFRMKTIFGPRLLGRLFETQCTEAFIRCAALNRMTRLGMPESYVVGS